MDYRVYTEDDMLIQEEHCIRDAKEAFGQIYDNAIESGWPADSYKVKVFINIAGGIKKFQEYTLPEFLSKPIPNSDIEVRLSAQKDPTEEDKRVFDEQARNYTEDEYKTVLKYIPTGYILGELGRRFDEYNKATDGIASLLDNMKIYNKE